jgi:arsenate reductase (thioredoxin)
MQKTINISSAGNNDLVAIKKLLADNKLPIDDITGDNIDLLIAKDKHIIIAVIGLEKYGEYGLLRSMATHISYRNQGIAEKLMNELFSLAAKKGIQEMYLLTETAEQYFEKRGFIKTKREDVPDHIRESSEFSSVCPASAAVMKKAVKQKKKLLFVCVENSNRSQMSQAFATMLGGENVEAYSAGSKPSGVVNPKAIVAMKELGYDLSKHDSKSLQEVEQYAPFDAVITMGCDDACPWMPAKLFIDWQIPDPKNMEPGEFNEVRDFIKMKVEEMLRLV